MRLTFRMIMVTVVACILAASALDTKKQDLQVKITGGRQLADKPGAPVKLAGAPVKPLPTPLDSPTVPPTIPPVQAAEATDTKPRKRAKHMRTWSKAARTEMDEALDDLIDSLDGELAVAVAKAEAAAARADKAAQAAEQAAARAEAQAQAQDQAVPPSGEPTATPTLESEPPAVKTPAEGGV